MRIPLALVWMLFADSQSGGSVTVPTGRTTTLVVAAEVGAPLELAVPSRAYPLAVAADAEQRWADAEALYREAVSDWNAAARLRPGRALELAIAKGERERQRSQLLAARARSTARRGDREPAARRLEALDEARLLRAKLMTVRAVLGRVPPSLYARTRDRLEEALRAGVGLARMPGETEIRFLLCATHAAAGDPRAARQARAAITQADRADPSNGVPAAACAAALGEAEAALAELEILALHPGPGRSDRFALREIYIANDWDRLRGSPRFEALFPR